MPFNANRLGKGLFASMTRLTHNAKRFRLSDSAPLRVTAEVVDKDGDTALRSLCQNDNVTLEMIELYLKHAPRAAELVNKHGSTAIYYLCKNNKKIFLHYIEKIF